MAAVTAPARTGDVVNVPFWAYAVLVAGVLAAYVVLQENGWLVSNWSAVHELFHDGRHALGFPCH